MPVLFQLAKPFCFILLIFLFADFSFAQDENDNRLEERDHQASTVVEEELERLVQQRHLLEEERKRLEQQMDYIEDNTHINDLVHIVDNVRENMDDTTKQQDQSSLELQMVEAEEDVAVEKEIRDQFERVKDPVQELAVPKATALDAKEDRVTEDQRSSINKELVQVLVEEKSDADQLKEQSGSNIKKEKLLKEKLRPEESMVEASVVKGREDLLLEDVSSGPEDIENNANQAYGVDVSWPMQSMEAFLAFSNSNKSFMSHRSQAYYKFMLECAKRYSIESCQKSDHDRIQLNARQPALQTNFTTLGYAKLPAPVQSFRKLLEFWNRQVYASSSTIDKSNPGQSSRRQRRTRREDWAEASVYVNHWTHPTEILHIDDDNYGMSIQDRQVLVDEVRSAIQRWISKSIPLVATSIYGIRVYPFGSILAPHVDRLPLVLSAVINVAQSYNNNNDKIDDHWVLEVIGHDKKAVNLTLQPGEMIVYEGHSVIHGRPFPFSGQYYANLFLHFEPLGYTEELKRNLNIKARRDDESYKIGDFNRKQRSGRYQSAKVLFEEELVKQQQLQQKTQLKTQQLSSSSKWPFNTLPSYISEGTLEAKRWLQQFIFYRKEKQAKASSIFEKKKITKYVTKAHQIAAGNGDVEDLKQVVKDNPKLLFMADDNGWKPLHEAARFGKLEILEYIIEEGKESLKKEGKEDTKFDINERTNWGNGANALWWAKHHLGDNHPVVRLLEQHGAVVIAPNDE